MERERAEERKEMAKYIKKGSNLLCYEQNGEYHFIPSRFIGYKNNSLIKHYNNKKARKISAISTEGTSTLLNKLFGVCKQNDKLDQIFKEYCESLDQTAENKIRKYWEIPSEFLEKLNNENFEEGGIKLATHKRHERNQSARNKCIELHGTVCKTCEVDLKDVYGDLAAGYIQVHHIMPISHRDKSYNVDPEKDLIPVCPNCHAMLHRCKDGLFMNPEELSNIIIKIRKRKKSI